MNVGSRVGGWVRRVSFALLALLLASDSALAHGKKSRFVLEEATISDIHKAILTRKLTATELVVRYLERIKAYNGTCVDEPEGILGPITMIPNAGKLNALMTLNLRPKHRLAWGFDERKARSMTDPVDDDPGMPDALETAALLDWRFRKTGKLVGPLHGVVIALKDQYDTFDMRTTSGADAFWANDRPPDDSTVAARLRAAGAILLAKANMDEYAGGDARSSFGGTGCNAYDTERDPGGSSGGSAVAVAANFVTCAIAEETGGSIIKPARWNNVVGIVPTRELVSADGMIQRGVNTRVGPMCRTVEDVARILDAYAGYDPKDELTAFSKGRKPPKPYYEYAKRKNLKGYRTLNWTGISGRGFAAMTVPAGFTTRVYDRGPDGELLPPIASALPVGMDVLGLPFTEHVVFEIGSAYEAASRNRSQPPGFGPLD
ncbi:MAG: amidase [Myxococcota bacterium]